MGARRKLITRMTNGKRSESIEEQGYAMNIDLLKILARCYKRDGQIRSNSFCSALPV